MCLWLLCEFLSVRCSPLLLLLFNMVVLLMYFFKNFLVTFSVLSLGLRLKVLVYGIALGFGL